MSVEAVRKVTIIVDVKPGEIVKPDVSWIAAMTSGIKELVTEQDALTEIVKKTHEEHESLVKTQTEAVKVEGELREQKSAAAKEAQEQAKDEADAHKKTIEGKKKEQETYDEWFARTQAMYAENQRKIDEQAAARRAEALKQQKQQQGGDAAKPFEIPTPNPRLPLRDPDDSAGFSRVDFREKQLEQQRERQKRADEAEKQRRIQEHQKELAEIDRINAQEKAKQEQEEQKLQEKKLAEAQRTFQKIKVAELANVRERLQQEEAEQEKKIEAASRLFEKIRKAEKQNVRERLQEEQDEQERKVEAANRMFDKIRKAEKTAVRERLQEEQAEEEQRVEAASRMLERIRKAEKAAVRERIAEAEDTFEKIKAAEQRHATQRKEGAEKADDDMPKHWRNVGLNAGQAVASVARYIGHMRLLKNVGGEALEKVAKEFMTIQSRVETISASTSTFTNLGTMIDGLQKAGKATEEVVVMQGILGKETSATQNLTMGLGKAAATVLPMIAPLQLTFTAITAAIVAADIAMDFFVESEADAAEKAAKLIQTYDEGLDKVIKKLQVETDLLNSQNGLIEAQWEIKKLMAGEAGLSAEDQQRMMDEKRKQADSQTQQSLRDSAVTIIQAGVPEEVKKAQEQNKEEAKRIAEEQKSTRALIAEFDRRIDEGQRGTIFGDRDRAEQKMARLNKEAQANFERQNLIDMDTDAALQEKLKTVKVKDGAIENFDDLLNDFKWSDNPTAKKSMTELSKQMSEAALLVAGQQSSAFQASEEAKMQKKAKEQETIDLSDRLADEEAVAERFKLTDSKFATEQVDTYLKQMEDPAATLDSKKMSVDNIRDVLGRADLVTPDLAKILDRGASAKPEEIKSALTDASEVTSAERKEFEDLIQKADAAIQKAEDDAMNMAAVADKLTRMLEVNSKQLNDLQRAIDSRDGI
jgi:hypothetical protein